ncbi:F-box protein At2g27310-like [Argentina anserina]|uniref:F-box protein At2g27310-like n=1 Tax=Argentina anserina TaxID=57926 RepID=UPI002176850A|nr:F-box protein At2g27310-like [Potentilla anserina]
MASFTAPIVEQGSDASISSLHSDIITSHILTRLDGPTLAAASCASSELHALSADQTLWKDICDATWPSVSDERVEGIISTFPSGHRSFFSDSFPLLDHSSSCDPSLLARSSELISAVDIFYKGELVFSKVQETETETGWFLCSPFRIDLLEPKETVPTPIRHIGDTNESLKHLEENLTLSWIVIDLAQKRAANLSSRKPVSVTRHWLTGEVQLHFATIMPGYRRGEFVQCGMVVTCKGSDGGELHVREVSMQMEAMEGNHLNGKESLIILQGAIKGGERKRETEDGSEGKAKFGEFLEMKRERKERTQRRERALDMICIATGVTLFMAFWSFVLFR